MKKLAVSAAALLAFAAPAAAEVIEVEMLNRTEDGRNMAFSQELIMADVGDVIRFVPTDRGHNAQTVEGAIPDGQEGIKGRINEAVEYEVTEPGVSAIICLPHVTLGMVAVVVADGDLSNADAVRDAQIRGRSGQKVDELLSQAEADLGS
ncbi:Pseudoazurin precursor [Roseivivax jejudonensis]|uniref:Pseudoazurin n=1 Tax=Roseivivax jejudonensis TaxID=1529041 RepID=A0A1X6YSK5_9RHOB|nr:plastocyanin/azurin family copper-binding protein [Roseivivax jejudonensis]SLN30008.1 Pseudoazurin precursor [Roseivivax jejudonensis]